MRTLQLLIEGARAMSKYERPRNFRTQMFLETPDHLHATQTAHAGTAMSAEHQWRKNSIAQKHFLEDQCALESTDISQLSTYKSPTVRAR